jgi:hypothetical protein
MMLRIPKFYIVPALFLVTFFTTVPANAQITIKIPKLREIFREKPVAEPSPKPATRENEQTVSGSEQETARIPQTEPSQQTEPVNDCDRGREYVHLRDLEKTKKEALSYVPGQREYYVSILSDKKNEYLEAALIPWDRKEWFKESGEMFKNCLTPALDDLAEVARKSLPTYTGPKTYTFGTPADKKLLQSAIPDISTARVFSTGLRQANWLIEKDNFNFPTARYKHGAVIFKVPSVEYCWVYYINIVQDYAGGGTYGASYGNYVGRSLSGCPAGK